MNCNCRGDIELQLTEKFALKSPEATSHKVELQGYGFAFNETGVETTAFMEAKATATYQLKGGGSKQKTTKQNMIFSYCPFCGKAAKP